MTILSKYITCSTGASNPVSSILLTITIPVLPASPSSSAPNGNLKLLMLVSCLEGSVYRAPLVNDLQRNAIFDGLAHCVFVDVIAEDPLGLVNRRAGIGNASRVRNALIQVRSQHRVLGAVRLIRHHK